MTEEINVIATPENTNSPATPGQIAQLRVSRKYHEEALKIYGFQWWVAISYLVGGGLAGYAIADLTAGGKHTVEAIQSDVISDVIIGAVIGMSGYSAVAFTLWQWTLRALKEDEKKLADLGFIDLVEGLGNAKDFYSQLVQINFTYIEKYYKQTQEQADKSFKLAAFASVSSFLILAFGIRQIFEHTGDTTPATLTTIAGVLTSFVSAVFFYLYNQTVQKMSVYHKKLVVSQNINLALKIAQDIEEKEKKYDAMKSIIEKLIVDINGADEKS